ncbi:hypothetical protein T484DRAFT_1979800, partial [Baffinella frigidus]
MMKDFKQRLADHLPAIQGDPVLPKGLIKAAEIDEHLSQLKTGKLAEAVEQRRRAFSKEECSICLQEFGPQADCLTTACKHTFHTFCLVEVLGTGACTSCPLCRTAVEKLVPGFVDGQMLKLIARLRMGTDAAQWAHKSVFADIQTRAMQSSASVDALSTRSFLPWKGMERQRNANRARAAIEELQSRLKLLELLSDLNAQYFRQTCAAIAKDLSEELAAQVKEKYLLNQSHFRDCTTGDEGNGMTKAVHLELENMLEAINVKFPTSKVITEEERAITGGCTAGFTGRLSLGRSLRKTVDSAVPTGIERPVSEDTMGAISSPRPNTDIIVPAFLP